MISTTFYDDFSIADRFGAKAVQDTYNRAFESWKDNYKYLTALTINLNWKLWDHYEKGNKQLAKLYEKLWMKADSYATTHLKGDELQYYYKETD